MLIRVYELSIITLCTLLHYSCADWYHQSYFTKTRKSELQMHKLHFPPAALYMHMNLLIDQYLIVKGLEGRQANKGP